MLSHTKTLTKSPHLPHCLHRPDEYVNVKKLNDGVKKAYFYTNATMDLNIKFLEILCNLVHEQNTQLLTIICTQEDIDVKKAFNLLPSRYEIKKMLLACKDHRLEKSNSTSLSSSSSVAPSSSSEVE